MATTRTHVVLILHAYSNQLPLMVVGLSLHRMQLFRWLDVSARQIVRHRDVPVVLRT